MRALWPDRPNCSQNVSQNIERIKCFSELKCVDPQSLIKGEELGSLRFRETDYYKRYDWSRRMDHNDYND